MENRRTERTPCKCFRCGSEDHLISKCPKPPKDNEKRRKQVRFSERGNRASQKECDNGNNDNDKNIYASMSHLSDNDKSAGRYFGHSSQLNNWIFDSGATCHMTPQVSYFIPGPLEDTDKHIEVVDGHHVTSKKKGKVQIKMCDYNIDNFIAKLHNAIVAPDQYDRLCYIIMLINVVHTCLFKKGFCTM